MPPGDEQWHDRSPHEEGFVSLEGVRLHFLDWGGKGPPLVLLPGLGDTAHIFDEFAPLLTGSYRVLALTRRGHGGSSTPTGGYDPYSLAGDVVGFFDALKLQRVTLVGHSIAGNELTALATLAPEKLTRLVYLDAAYDRRGTSERMKADPAIRLPRPAPPTSLAEYRTLGRAHFGFWNDALEANLRARLQRDRDGSLRGAAPALLREMVEESNRFEPDYRLLQVPALAVYSMFGDEYWSERVNEQVHPGRLRQFMREVMQPWQEHSIRQFEEQTAAGEVLRLEDSHHYLFFSHRQRLVRLLRELVPAQ